MLAAPAGTPAISNADGESVVSCFTTAAGAGLVSVAAFDVCVIFTMTNTPIRSTTTAIDARGRNLGTPARPEVARAVLLAPGVLDADDPVRCTAGRFFLRVTHPD
jgi:hypothetical protein